MTTQEIPSSTGSPTPLAAPRGVRVALAYAVDGDLRFISHRDEMRVLGRALARAAWPLRYSAGFNPAPHLSIALPRSTGMASACQIALIDLLSEPLDARALVERLARTLPETMPAQRLFVDDVPRSLHPKLATYECALGEHVPAIPRADEPLYVMRASAAGRPATPIDVREFVELIEICDSVLRMRLRFDGERSARPIDILKSIGLGADDRGHCLRRVEVVWNETLAGRALRPSPTARAAQADAQTPAARELRCATTDKRNSVDQEEAHFESPREEGGDAPGRHHGGFAGNR